MALPAILDHSAPAIVSGEWWPWPLSTGESVVVALISASLFIGGLALIVADRTPVRLRAGAKRWWLDLLLAWVLVFMLWWADRVVGSVGSPIWITVDLAMFAPLWVLLVPVLFWERRAEAMSDALEEDAAEREAKSAGRRVPPRNAPTLGGIVISALRGVATLTIAFTVVTVVLVAMGAVDVARPVAPGQRVWAVFTEYTWHISDEIPALKVPQTLGWELRPVASGTVAGLLLLAFKIAVIFPAIRLVRDAWELRKTAQREEALRRIRPRDQRRGGRRRERDRGTATPH